MAKADLSLDYANGQFIPDADSYPEKWADKARAYREVEHAIGRARLNQNYGPDPRQVFDLFLPAGRAKGLIVFVHGGYWMAFDCKSWSHLATGATANGWAVAMPSYLLAPQVRIAEITKDISKAIACAASLVGGPIRLCGHSAGGHLVARMNCVSSGLPSPVQDRIEKIVPISGLSDLRPLLQTNLNATLGLDPNEADEESPFLCVKRLGITCDVWVGAEERPAFIDQSRWLAQAWDEAVLRFAPGKHHFDVIDDLAEPNSAILQSLLG